MGRETTKVENRTHAASVSVNRAEASRVEDIAGNLFNDAGKLLRDGHRDQAVIVLEIASRFANRAALIEKAGTLIYAG